MATLSNCEINIKLTRCIIMKNAFNRALLYIIFIISKKKSKGDDANAHYFDMLNIFF